MAKDKEQWITVNGRHIKLVDGESKKDAIERTFASKVKKVKAKATTIVDKFKDSDKNNTAIVDKVKSVVDTVNIRTELRNASDKLQSTVSVFSLSKQDMPSNSKSAITALNAKLAPQGGNVERKGFGKVQVSKRLSSKYVNDKAEMVAILAIPNVIKSGLIISKVNDHKERGYSTVTFGAKVNIADKDAHMAVSVKETSKNFYTAHRVILPNGESLKL